MAIVRVPMLWCRSGYGQLYEFPRLGNGNLGPLAHGEFLQLARWLAGRDRWVIKAVKSFMHYCPLGTFLSAMDVESARSIQTSAVEVGSPQGVRVERALALQRLEHLKWQSVSRADQPAKI